MNRISITPKIRTLINLICSILLLICNLAINFFLSPIIVERIGVEANGFVTLANNFVTYANIVVVGLNGMASRFITIAYTKKDYEKANLYYNSVFWGNLIIVAILIVPAILCLVYLEYLLEIPSNLLFDVKVLFGLSFLVFFIQTSMPKWDAAPYATNRMDYQYIPNVITQIIRFTLVIGAMLIFSPKVRYIGIGALVATILFLISKFIAKEKLTPELKIQFLPRIICDKSSLIELTSSGVWNAVSQLGTMLLTGLDLVICNIFLGANEMGIYSVAITLPHLIQQLGTSIISAFDPQIVISYGNGNKKELLKVLDMGVKSSTILLGVMVAGVIVLGKEFYTLWMPSQDATILQILTILASMNYLFLSGSQPVYSIYTAANKVKQNSLSILLSGVVSCIITILFCLYTDIGIYAVAGVSVVINLIKNFIYSLAAPATYIGEKRYKFYPQTFICFIFVALVSVCGFAATYFISYTGRIWFFTKVLIVGIIGVVLSSFIVLRKNDRKLILNKVRSVFIKKS